MPGDREVLEVDVLFVGGGPASLSGAYRLASLIEEHNARVEGSGSGEKLPELTLALIEKGTEIGAHSLSGAVLDPVALKELLPEFKEKGAPVSQEVTAEEVLFLTGKGKIPIPLPPIMSNHGNYIISLNQFTKWLAKEVEGKGVYLFPGTAGADLLIEGESVVGVRTGDKGLDRKGEPKSNFEPGMDIRARVTVLGEGTLGTLTRKLIKRFNLSEGKNPLVYSTGVKEIWEIQPGKIQAGKVIHTMGYPLKPDAFGGGFIYAMDATSLIVGFVVGLDYQDPFLDPHEELQKYKLHPYVAPLLEGGKMVRYGAKTIPEGGYYSIPKLAVNGALIAGDSAGFVNVPKLKGIHYAMKSGILAAQVIYEALLKSDFSTQAVGKYEKLVYESYIGKDLYVTRNFRQGFSRGLIPGLMQSGLIFATGGLLLPGKQALKEDFRYMKKVSQYYSNGQGREKMKFDGKLTFNKITSVYFSGTKHEENQPCHLVVADLNICSTRCKEEYGNPCQHFCPANVYEMEKDEETGGVKLRINASNCVHCKTCDIKDPYNIIEWVTPEGGGGPNYINL